MGTDFQSFDKSPLSAFIQSPLHARGDGVYQGSLFVVHSGTTFDGVTTDGFAYYDNDTAAWLSVPATTGLSKSGVATLIVSGGRFFCLSSAMLLWGTVSGTTKFHPGEDWRDDLGYSANWFSSIPAIVSVIDFKGDLLVVADSAENIIMTGDPGLTASMVKHNPNKGRFEAFGTMPTDAIIQSACTHGNYIILKPEHGIVAVTLIASGYVNAVSGDIGKTVTFQETGNIQTSTGVITGVDHVTPSNNTFTVTLDGESESVPGDFTETDTSINLVDACNNSTKTAFQNVTFTQVGTSTVEAEGLYPDQTFSISLTVTGALGTVTDFTDAFASRTDLYASGELRRYDNATRTWLVELNEVENIFFNDYADVAITLGTGEGTYNGATPYPPQNAYYYSTDGETWQSSGIEYTFDVSGDPLTISDPYSAGGRLFIGGENDALSNNGATGSFFEWNVSGDSYTAISGDDLISTTDLVAAGSKVYYGKTSEGLFSVSGNVATLEDSDYGLPAVRGNDLIIANSDETVSITKPPYNFHQLASSSYIEYLDSSGTSSDGNEVSKVFHAEQDGAMTLSGTFIWLSIISVSPAEGAEAGSTSVTITGTAFTVSTTVTFDGVAASNISFVSATEITCDTPSGSGVVDVVVTDNGETSTLTNGYEYLTALSIISISPTSGTTAGGTSVTVTGTGFTASTTVDFRGSLATNVVLVNSTSITCDTPAKIAGTYTVTVTDGADSDYIAAAYTYT